MVNASQDGKTRKSRSPNYPAVGLREAIERTKLIYDSDGKAGCTPEAAAKRIGYSGRHGLAMTMLSALSKFGLTENKGGRVVPTKAAIDIFSFPPEHERHKTALAEAALMPDIYRAIVDRFREVGELPSNESLKPELIADDGFTPKAIDGFVADFRDSLEYAGLLVGNQLKLSKNNGDIGVGKNNNNPPPPGETTKNENWQLPPEVKMRELPITLPSLNVAVVKVPEKMTELDFQTLVNMINAWKSALVPVASKTTLEDQRGETSDDKRS